MSVNSYKLRVGDIASNGGVLKFPIDMVFSTVDQAEVVQADFVSKELENAINPIVDYEKARFSPIDSFKNEMVNISYELNFLSDDNVIPNQSMYSDIGFNNDDIKFRKNGFIRSFLRLNFYDNDAPSNQRLISFLTIYSRVSDREMIPFGQPNGGLPIGANQFPVRFIVSNPVINPNGFAEGFYIYNFKDEVLDNLPKELYMRAEFNNAKTGERTSFITVNTPQSIDNVVSKLHTRYILRRDTSGFYYEIDTSYSTNIIYTGDVDNNGISNDGGVRIKLYEIQVI